METEAVLVSACPSCAAPLSPDALACASCKRFVHAARLKALADEAQTAEARGDRQAAAAAWSEAARLLPHEAAQRRRVDEKIAALHAATPPDVDAAASPRTKRPTGLAAGAILVATLAKAKTLLLALTKTGSIVSLFVAFGVYWAAFGWKFGAGLLASIYVHEIGHVIAFIRYGIPTTGPMFVPGLGAYVRALARPATATQDAWIGLAGPIAGAGAAVACLAAGRAFAWPAFTAVGASAGLLNLFNLLPVWQLDGAHAFRALDTRQRWLTAAAILVAFFTSGHGLLFLMALAAAYHAWKKQDAPLRGDFAIWLSYVVLVLGLVTIAAQSGAAAAPPG